jgi:hypothetical protein
MAGLSAATRPVVPVFEVEFTGGTDGRCRGPLGELWGVPFERVAPVRSFPSFRGQVSFPGLYVVGVGQIAAPRLGGGLFGAVAAEDVSEDGDRLALVRLVRPVWLGTEQRC